MAGELQDSAFLRARAQMVDLFAREVYGPSPIAEALDATIRGLLHERIRPRVMVMSPTWYQSAARLAAMSSIEIERDAAR